MKTATAEYTVHTELGVNTQPAQRLVLDFIFTCTTHALEGQLSRAYWEFGNRETKAGGMVLHLHDCDFADSGYQDVSFGSS